jgi:hypothetical protein
VIPMKAFIGGDLELHNMFSDRKRRPMRPRSAATLDALDQEVPVGGHINQVTVMETEVGAW